MDITFRDGNRGALSVQHQNSCQSMFEGHDDLTGLLIDAAWKLESLGS
jgi:hypothetical protein